jgi:predicted nuclease of restriction endonuclease-like (RecB) superfamily
MASDPDELADPDILETIYLRIAEVLQTARDTAYHAVNNAMVQAYWEIGRIIVEEEQQGRPRAVYGAALIPALAKRLTTAFGKGFTETNLKYIRLFYLAFSIRHALRDELSWTHYRLLLKVQNEEARQFYLQETIRSGWSTRELERQVNTLLFERLTLSQDKDKTLQLAAEGQVIRTGRDLIKDPYVLEFLAVRENQTVQEKDIEQGLINRLQEFLLELGKGFAFVARQRRISVDGDHFYVDLVFYNFLLKCFVLIDLKLGKLTHQDIGQMDFYVRYFEQEEKQASDNPTLGLILCSDRSEAMVKYTLLSDSQQIFASRYKLHLPTEEELERELQTERTQIEQERHLLNDLSPTSNEEE